jgi:hypothetical protein
MVHNRKVKVTDARRCYSRNLENSKKEKMKAKFPRDKS